LWGRVRISLKPVLKHTNTWSTLTLRVVLAATILVKKPRRGKSSFHGKPMFMRVLPMMVKTSAMKTDELAIERQKCFRIEQDPL